MTVLYQKNPSPELAHMCWCLLVAVKMARRAGKIASDLQEHLLIMQWLANAQKRHLFPKIVANDIVWFIAQGKKYGYGAKLYNKVEYIYRSRSGALTEKSALFRFTYLVETLKTMGWLDYLLSPQEWKNYRKASSAASAIYTPKALLHASFDGAGELVKPLPLRFTGDISGLPRLIDECGFAVRQLPEEKGFIVLEFVPRAEG